MPRTAHQLDAVDLLEDGTYSLRRALDRLANRSHRPAAVDLPEHVPTLEQERRQDRPDDVPVAHRGHVLMDA